MKRISVLFVGCGDLGARTGGRLHTLGWQSMAVRRNASHQPAGFDTYAADYTVPGSLSFIARLRPDYVVATFNPVDRSEAGYLAGFRGGMANLLAGLGSHVPRHIIAVSSTRVFAERQGGWVDEDSPLSRDDPLAGAIIAAEQLLLSTPHPATIVRFAGIYGAPGGRLLARIASGQLCEPTPLRYSNRIHRSDCAGFIAHLLQLAAAGQLLAPVYVGVDDEPAPQYEVERWLADELGVEPGGLSVGANRGPTGHKRCRNTRMRQTGYELEYPDFRAGYRAVIATQAAAGAGPDMP